MNRTSSQSQSVIWAICLLTLTCVVNTQADSAEWIRVPKDTLDGVGIPVVETAAEDGLPNSYFRELEPAVHPKFGLISAERLQTAVVETPGEITRSLDFPGDEIVQMRSGSTILIDDEAGQVAVARTGDYFIVPAHWRGIWIFHSENGRPAREHAMVSAPDYSAQKPPLNAASLPKRGPSVTVLTAADISKLKQELKPLNFATLKGEPAANQLGHTIFSGEPSFLLLAARASTQFTRPAARCDSVVRVISGSLTLEGPDRQSATFGAEDVVVIKHTFQGTVRFGGGFVGLSVISSGTGSPPWPGKATPTTEVCPAL